MEVSLRITPLARQDIVEAASYIAQDSLEAADHFLDAIETMCLELASMPELGTLCHFTNPGLAGVRVRTIAGFQNHLAFYQKDGNELLIIRVIHGARDWQSLFEE